MKKKLIKTIAAGGSRLVDHGGQLVIEQEVQLADTGEWVTFVTLPPLEALEEYDARKKEWLSMQSAPKDGTYILGWYPAWGRAVVVRWDQTNWSAGDYDDLELTFWTPLPKAPKV